ncbi:ATP-binding protein [Deinococcus misasensis]|uniref:ATP-binding protein n=1 Tax=Deinococcus misasensis TaxID=392413 RepID=UPI0005512FF0|nr:ATP-binding protein [Deinococcus misasensis]
MKRKGQQTLTLFTALLVVALVALFQFIAHQVLGFEDGYDHHHTLMDTTLSGLTALCGSMTTFVLLRRSNAPLERMKTYPEQALQHGEGRRVQVTYQKGSSTISDNGRGVMHHVKLGLGLQVCKTQMRLKGGDLKLQNTSKGPELKLWWT